MGNNVVVTGTDVNFKLLDRETFTTQTTSLSSVLARLADVEDESATNSDSIDSITDRVTAIEHEIFTSLVGCDCTSLCALAFADAFIQVDSSLMPGGMFADRKNMPNFATAESFGDFSIVPVPSSHKETN